MKYRIKYLLPVFLSKPELKISFHRELVYVGLGSGFEEYFEEHSEFERHDDYEI